MSTSSEYSVLPFAIGVLSKIAKFQYSQKRVIWCTDTITQHVKTANVWMKTDPNTTVWWHGTESRNYNAESANKASECNEARKEPWATVPQCGHKTFLHQNLVWSCLETLTRAGIVSPRSNQHSFHAGNTDCHHPKCCPHLESSCVSWEMPWHVIPLKIVLHVS